ncbi:hypothetical protein ISS42_02215, partial [Candidatus Shapirobacteria bacterium]|nr:hypothetical protein [Candidatus Shapirobacteria bacterium]
IYSFGWGITGLVLAISLSAFIRFIILLMAISWQLPDFAWDRFWQFVRKTLVVGLISGPVFWLLMRLMDQYLLNTTRVFDLLLLTGGVLLGGSLVYLWLSLKLKITQARVFLKLVKKLVNFRQAFLVSKVQMEKPKELFSTP